MWEEFKFQFNFKTREEIVFCKKYLLIHETQDVFPPTATSSCL